MSANNQILVKEHKGKYYVFMTMAESWSEENELFVEDALGVYNTEEEALKNALKFQEEYLTEYGVCNRLCKDCADVKIVE